MSIPGSVRTIHHRKTFAHHASLEKNRQIRYLAVTDSGRPTDAFELPQEFVARSLSFSHTGTIRGSLTFTAVPSDAGVSPSPRRRKKKCRCNRNGLSHVPVACFAVVQHTLSTWSMSGLLEVPEGGQ